MSYTITVRIFQANPSRGYFRLVEKDNWNYANGGTWSHEEGTIVLRMGGSGTCGLLRFESDSGERITATVGVHNYKRWCDVVTGLKPNETGVLVIAQYYNNGGRDYMREKQLAQYSVTSSAGTNVEIKYTVTEGNNLKADIIIG